MKSDFDWEVDEERAATPNPKLMPLCAPIVIETTREFPIDDNQAIRLEPGPVQVELTFLESDPPVDVRDPDSIYDFPARLICEVADEAGSVWKMELPFAGELFSRHVMAEHRGDGQHQPILTPWKSLPPELKKTWKENCVLALWDHVDDEYLMGDIVIGGKTFEATEQGTHYQWILWLPEKKSLLVREFQWATADLKTVPDFYFEVPLEEICPLVRPPNPDYSQPLVFTATSRKASPQANVKVVGR